jgi:hypothetical protein
VKVEVADLLIKFGKFCLEIVVYVAFGLAAFGEASSEGHPALRLWRTRVPLFGSG